MASLAREQPRHVRQWSAVAVAVAVAAILVVRFSVPSKPVPAPPAAPDFVESVVLLDGHTCIWLEPATPTGGTHE